MIKHPTLRIILWIFLFGLVGGLFSCLLGYGLAQKWTVPWHTLPETEGPVRGIRGVTVDSVDVETTNGGLLRFQTDQPEQGWQKVDAPLNESDEDCKLLPSIQPPADALEQRLACANYADGGVTTMFVLRRDRRVAYWSASDSAYEGLFFLIICPVVGVPAGMVLGAVLGFVLGVFKRWQHAAPSPNP